MCFISVACLLLSVFAVDGRVSDRALWHGVAVQSSRGESAESRVDRGADGRASRSRKIPRLHAHEFYVRGQCRSLCAVACKLIVTIAKEVFNVWRTGYD